MAEYLMANSVPRQHANAAAYYAQSTAPIDDVGRVNALFADTVNRGFMTYDNALDALVSAELKRPVPTPNNPGTEHVAEVFGRLVTGGAMPYEVAIGLLASRILRETDNWESADDLAAAALDKGLATADAKIDEVTQCLDAAVARAEHERDYAGAVPEVRRDISPALAAALGIKVGRAPSTEELGHLLSGQRADGAEIEGKQRQSATASLQVALGLEVDRAPDWTEVSHILAGRRADGGAVEGSGTATARSRFLHLMGVASNSPDPAQERHLLAGRMADGSVVNMAAYAEGVQASKGRIAYVDMTFSADKSLSVAWALAPTEAERAILIKAHKDAVDATMAYVATQLGYMRMGKGGLKGREQGDVAWVSVDHHTARPVVENVRQDAAGAEYTEFLPIKSTSGDPQLHTHSLLLGTVLTETGRVGSVDLDVIAGRVKEWGGLYQAFVATNLRQSGVDVALDAKTGAARLSAVPDAVRKAYSSRTEDGTDAAREFARANGQDWDALTPERRSALINTSTAVRRNAKTDGGTDMAAWGRQAKAMGYEHASVLRPDAVPTPLSRDDRLETAREASLNLVDAALQRNAKLDAQELRVIATRGLVASGVESAADIDALTKSYRDRGVRQHGQDTGLIWGRDTAVRGKARFGVTTALHETQERELVRLARAGAADRSVALPLAAISAAVAAREAMPLDKGGLRFGSDHGKAQRAVMDVLGTGGRFGIAIGVAGSGKSALLAPLVDAWKADGRRVYGAALAWRQSDDLAGAGIAAKDRAALDAFLKRAERGAIALDHKSVVVVDEVGLIGTKQLLGLLKLQERHGFQLVAVGDDKQAQAIEAGPVIAILREALGEAAVPELLSSVRQRTERERETAGMFREGRAEEALARKRQDGTAILAAGSYADTVQRVATLWRERVEAQSGQGTVTVSAPTNADARAIGSAIREQRRAMGQIGVDAAMLKAQDQNDTAYDLPLAVGDRVRLFDRTHARYADKGTHGAIGNNGSVLEVRAVTKDGVTLRTSAGREGEVLWRNLMDKQTGRIRLAYGDVLSIDAIQGVTSAEHISAMPAGSAAVQGFKAYVAESRHQERSWLVVGEGAERREVSQRRMLNDARPIGESDVWVNIARNLSRQPAKPSALAFLERAVEIRRGAVDVMQAGLQRTEAAAMEGRPQSMLRDRTQALRSAVAGAVAGERAKRFRARVARAGVALRHLASRVQPAMQAMPRARPASTRKARARM